MPAMPTLSLLHFGLRRLLGPLSDKELRVASRRGRSYALRSGYLVLLCILMLSAWYQIVGSQAFGQVFGTSRASVVSRDVARTVILFQFVAAQLVAALALSSSIGDEMRRRTLGVLLTTPITSVHIVAGKLLGGLLQIVLLLAIGLPALAILRALGGLSWTEVFAAFWVTLTAALFAGAVSLLLSTYYRRSFQALSAGAVLYVVLFVGLPFVAACLVEAHYLNPSVTLSILDLTNPFRALYVIVLRMRVLRAAAAGQFFSWPLHCLIMAGAAAGIACLAVRRVRQVAVGGRLGRRRAPGAAERLWGAPVAWKEDPGADLLGRQTVVIVVVTVALCAQALLTKRSRGGSSLVMYPYYGLGALWLVMCLRLALGTAGAIAREKESGAWPVLLTTPLGDREILRGKVRAALRRDGVLLLALVAVEACFLFSQMRTQGLPSLTFYVFGRLAAVVLVLGAGLYFGVRLRTTTAAVIAALLLFLCVHYFLTGHYNPLWAWWSAKIVASFVSGGNPSARANYQLYSWVGVGAGFILDIVLGLLLSWRARRNLREYVF